MNDCCLYVDALHGDDLDHVRGLNERGNSVGLYLLGILGATDSGKPATVNSIFAYCYYATYALLSTFGSQPKPADPHNANQHRRCLAHRAPTTCMG